jgi:hypothetical protein
VPGPITAKLSPSAYDSGSGAWSATGGSIPDILKDASSGTYLYKSILFTVGGTLYTFYYTLEDIPTFALDVGAAKALCWVGVQVPYDGNCEFKAGFRTDGGSDRCWHGAYLYYPSTSGTYGANNSLVDITSVSPHYGSGTYNPTTPTQVNAIKAFWLCDAQADPQDSANEYLYEHYLQIQYGVPSGSVLHNVASFLGPIFGAALTWAEWCRMRTMLADSRYIITRSDGRRHGPIVMDDEEAARWWRELRDISFRPKRYFDLRGLCPA